MLHRLTFKSATGWTITLVLQSIVVSQPAFAQQSVGDEANECVVRAVENWDIPKLAEHFKRQQKAFDSLSLRVRRSATIVDNGVKFTTSLFSSPIRAGVDESILVYQGDRQYARTLELDYPDTDADDDESTESRVFADEAHSVSGNCVLGRHRSLATGKHEFTEESADDVIGCFPQHSFVRNMGWARPDPTASRESKQMEELWCLPRFLSRGAYAVDGTETIADTRCLRIVGRFAIDASFGRKEPHSVDDTVWLDVERGMAVRARNVKFESHVVEIRNRRFKELADGVWIPQDSQLRVRHAADSANRSDLLCTESLTLQYAHALSVPDELFTVALRPLKVDRLLGKEIAYHYVDKWSEFRDCRTVEGWSRPGVGRRYEVRDRNSDLLLLTIDNRKCRLSFMPNLKRVLVSTSRLEKASTDLRAIVSDPDYLPHLHETIQTSESLTALIVKEVVDLDGQNAIKITSIFPSDPVLPVEFELQPLEWPIHEFDPVVIREINKMEFRTRTHWFHNRHLYPLKRQCGCKAPKHEYTVEYPDDPGQIDSNLFEFETPENAKVDVSEPELLEHFKS